MIAELILANQAFAVIKETIQNGGELVAAGQQVIDWFSAKNSLQKKVEEKQPDERSDLEEFFALEQLKQQEKELREAMIYQGRPGLWDDWLAFQVKAREGRESAKRAEIKAQLEKEKKRKEMVDEILAWVIGIGAVLTGGFVLWFAWDLITSRLK